LNKNSFSQSQLTVIHSGDHEQPGIPPSFG
jgi:hypothetical protein